ncbi:sensor histidine kinase [Paenibacillus ginsengarvi]|uniref:histidine kinase n=1 Tax=Paenibacillus ginsengarvi TaxID=400777 RepID=A0A3B0CJ38_9BACL|nr:sensor histidine kinase [Paenibacillus ginsengarvi]RKN84841.1 sensor histidine kinase [Paenibacillus ginsengarvi]
MRIKAWFYGLSFRNRVWLTIVLLITLAVSANGTISYFIAAKVVQNNAFRLSEDTINKTAQVVDQRLRNITVSMMSLTMSDPFKEMMDDVASANTSRYYQHLTLLQKVFSQFSFYDSYIQSILIATPIGDFYPTNSMRLTNQSFYDSELYKQAKIEKRPFWVPRHEDPFFSNREQVISLVLSTIGEIPNQDYNVYIIVNVKENDLLRLIADNQNTTETGLSYMFINEEGQEVVRSPLYAATDAKWRSSFLERLYKDKAGYFFFPLNGSESLINYARLEVGENWILLGVQSKERLLAQVNGIKRSTLYALFGCLLLSLFVSNGLTRLLLKPLYKLQELMKRVERNDLNVRFASPYRDEVAQVGFRFNRMLDEIKRLIQDVTDGEREKRKAEIKALTAQMDPHFLYNTLNTIYCKSELGKNDDVNDMILSLSHMFQLGLSNGRDWVTLEDEITHMQMYLAIQHKCYDTLFDYRLDIGSGVNLSSSVLKILLQPLVENAIVHGFENMENGGHIDIAIRAEAAQLILSVKDNGCGMDIEEVYRNMRHTATSNKGYALRNIAHRLQLYYGEQARMDLYSEPGCGAEVVLRLPVTEGGDAND